MAYMDLLEDRRLLAITPVTTDLLVSLPSETLASAAQVTATGKNTYVVAWNQGDIFSALPGGPIARATRLNASGHRVSADVSLPGRHVAPGTVAAVPGGGFLLGTWGVEDDGGLFDTYRGTYVRRYAPGGKAAGAERALSTGTEDKLAVATDGKGAAVIGVSDSHGAHVTRLDAGGRIAGKPAAVRLLNPPVSAGDYFVYDVAIEPDGTYWLAVEIRPSTGAYGEVLQHYDAKGRPTGASVDLSRIESQIGDVRLAVTPTGGLLAAIVSEPGYESSVGLGTVDGDLEPFNNRLTLARFTSAGKNDALAEDTLGGIDQNVYLAVDPAGTAFVLYGTLNPARRAGYAESGLDVMARTYSSDLSTSQSPVLIPGDSQAIERPGGVAAVAKGVFAVAWTRTDAVADGTYTDDPAALNRVSRVYTRVFRVPDPKAKGKRNVGGGLVSAAESASLAFHDGWYFTVAYSFQDGFFFNTTIALTRIEGNHRSAVVKEVLIPSDDQLADLELQEPAIRRLGIGSIYVPDQAHLDSSDIANAPVVWAPGTTFTVFSFHPAQPAFRASGRLVKITQALTSDVSLLDLGHPAFHLLDSPTAIPGPGVTAKDSNVGSMTTGQVASVPESQRVLVFTSSAPGGLEWTMSFYEIGAPEVPMLKVPEP